jgi:hypothetical protein
VLIFCGQRDSIQRIFVKEYFLFKVGSVCGVMRLHHGDKCSADDEEVETEVCKWLKQSKSSVLRVSTHW